MSLDVFSGLLSDSEGGLGTDVSSCHMLCLPVSWPDECQDLRPPVTLPVLSYSAQHLATNFYMCSSWFSSYIFIIYVHIVLDAACKTTCKAQSGRNFAKTSDDTSNGDDALRMLRADRGCFEALQLNRWSNRSGSGGRCRIRSQSFDLTRHMPRLPREGLSKTRHGGMAAWRLLGATQGKMPAGKRCQLGNVVRTPLKECSAVLNLLSIFSIFSMKNLSIFSEDGTLGHSCPSSHHSCSHMRPNLEAEFCDDFRCCNLQ